MKSAHPQTSEARRHQPAPRLGGALALDYRRDGRLAIPSAWPASIRSDSRRIDWGSQGNLLAAGTGIDWALNKKTAVAIVGGIRGRGGDFLRAADLLARGFATPQEIAADLLAGAGLVVAIDRHEPKLAAYATLLSMHPLSWSTSPRGFAAASEPALLLPLLDAVRINSKSVAAHLLFRFVPGEATYFENMHRLFPGSELRLDGENVSVRSARTMRDVVAGLPRFRSIDDEGLTWLDQRLAGAATSWVDEAWRRNVEVGNLLSGGLDSSLVQAWLIEGRGARAARSYSFAFSAPSFRFEVGNAEQASRLTGSVHRAPQLDERGYPELLERAIKALAEPTVYNEAWPGHLALAEAIGKEENPPRILFSGFGADTLHGVSELQTITRWQRLQRSPARRELLLRHRSRLGEQPRSANWLEALDMRAEPRSLRDPHSYDALAGEVELLAPMLGEDALFVAFEARRDVERRLFASDDLHESVQTMDLLTAGYDPTLAVGRLYATAGIDVVQIYLDEQALAAPFAFDPAIRFLRPRGPWSHRFKPLQQELMLRRGMGALVGRTKGGTSFNDELWQWMSVGCLRDRVQAIEQPWLSVNDLDKLTKAPNDVLWNLLTFDIFARSVAAPAARAAASDWRERSSSVVTRPAANLLEPENVP